MFANCLGVQKWQWYLFTVEALAMDYSKNKKVLQEHLDKLKRIIEPAPACE